MSTTALWFGADFPERVATFPMCLSVLETRSIRLRFRPDEIEDGAGIAAAIRDDLAGARMMGLSMSGLLSRDLSARVSKTRTRTPPWPIC